MKIHLLRSTRVVYSGNAYLILGNSNSLEDVNSLVDVGTDGSIVDRIASIQTGLGKRPVERVVLTHSHFDHAGGLSRVIQEYDPETCAYSTIEGVKKRLSNGEVTVLGDEEFEVLYVPEHSSDSICLYSSRTGVLFSGDTPLRINSPGGTYREDFVSFLEDLLRRNAKAIYSGHDAPVLKGVEQIIRNSLRNVEQSEIIARVTR